MNGDEVGGLLIIFAAVGILCGYTIGYGINAHLAQRRADLAQRYAEARAARQDANRAIADLALAYVHAGTPIYDAVHLAMWEADQ